MINLTFEIDDFPINLNPLISTDYNSKIINDISTFRLKHSVNCEIRKKDDVTYEIELYDSLLRENIYPCYFINTINFFINGSSPHSHYFKLILKESIKYTFSKISFRLLYPCDFFENILCSSFFVPVHKDEVIRKLAINKKRNFIHLKNDYMHIKFLVNKNSEKTIDLLKENRLDLTAFSHPNYLLYNYFQEETNPELKNYVKKEAKSSLIYYLKCTNKSFNQYILKCRPFIHDDFVNDKFLIPIDNFLGNEKLRRCSFENHEFIPKNIEKDRVISIGYSDFEPNKKIAESVAQSLNYLFGIKSRLVKFSNLISFIRKNEIVDVSVNVTYPTVDHEFSIFTNALFDYDEQVRREIINLLLKKNIKKLSYMSSFSNTMVPLFTSNFIYLTRLKNLEVDYFGKIVLKEKFYGN